MDHLKKKAARVIRNLGMPPLKTSENWIVSCGKEEPVSAAAERSEEGNGWEAGDELKVTTDLLARLLL